MLKSRNLDDQTYAQIIEAAKERIPWLCPQWTDHNAHDPGITLLELMAWYKEMQQYHMNRFTEPLECELLKLAGVRRRTASPARCTIEAPDNGCRYLAGECLETREEIPFELTQPIPPCRPRIERICTVRAGRVVEVGELLHDRHMTFQPFSDDGASQLQIWLSQRGEGELRLWFEVEKPEGVARNPFYTAEQKPRTLRWSCPAGEMPAERDETHALSVSGYVYLRPRADWQPDENGLFCLTLSLTDPGCEEAVRLSGISAGRYEAVQRETWARSYTFQAPAQPQWETVLTDAAARDGEWAVLIRQTDGWIQTDQWQGAPVETGRLLCVNTMDTAQDGEDNVMIAALDAARADGLLFDAKGLPGETFFLHLEGRTVLTEDFALLCQTLDRDGKTRLLPWRCVEDLCACGPRDRVFTYDRLRETITFGDGQHGALLCRGEKSVLALQMRLTYGSGGNIPAGEQLHFMADGAAVWNSAAAGGTDRESVKEAGSRLLCQLGTSRKCVTAQDYERLAKQTPGLRVAAAKAIPAYDPDEPAGVCRTPTVTVVVVPAGHTARPMPDQRFLQAVEAQLNAVRLIGTRVRVIPPVYVEVSVSATVYSAETHLEERVSRRLEAYLAEEQAGNVIRVNDVAVLLQNLPGVLRVGDVVLRAPGNGCYQNGDGDVFLPKQAIPCLKTLHLEQKPTDRRGE